MPQQTAQHRLIVADYLRKGTQVGIVGEAQLRPWTGKDGVEKQSLEVRVSDLTLLGSRQGGNAEHQTTRSAAAPRQSAPASSGGPMSDLDDEIPFAPVAQRSAWASV